MKKFLAVSLFLHTSTVGLVLNESFRMAAEATPESDTYIEFEVNDAEVNIDPVVKDNFWEKTGKTLRELFGNKSAYEVYRDGPEHGDLPGLSDVAEIEKEFEDEARRPAHEKKEIKFKSYIDNMGEAAIIPWFREVEKVVRMKKVYYDRTFETTVIVIINSHGHVVKVVTAQSSGDTLLDLAVKQAFVGLEFPHPPKELIDTDGFGRVKWVFEMYLNVDLRKKGKFRVYRRD